MPGGPGAASKVSCRARLDWGRSGGVRRPQSSKAALNEVSRRVGPGQATPLCLVGCCGVCLPAARGGPAFDALTGVCQGWSFPARQQHEQDHWAGGSRKAGPHALSCVRMNPSPAAGPSRACIRPDAGCRGGPCNRILRFCGSRGRAQQLAGYRMSGLLQRVNCGKFRMVRRLARPEGPCLPAGRCSSKRRSA